MNKKYMLMGLFAFTTAIWSYGQPAPLREATVAEMQAATQGMPAVVTPRRASFDGGTNGILFNLPEVYVIQAGAPDNVKTFTNAQAAVNYLTATNSTQTIVKVGSGTYVYPPVGGTIHFGNGEWFLTTNLLISVPYNCTLRLTGAGQLNSRLVAPSRVLTVTNNSQNLNFYLEVDHLGLFATNQNAKDAIIYEDLERFHLHDYLITRYNALFQTNTTELIWGVDCFTNATGLIGIYSASGLNKQMIHDGVIAGMAHDILDQSDHSVIYNNDFDSASRFKIKNGSIVLTTNLWLWTDAGFGRFTGGELSAAFSIGLADHGDFTAYNNHFFETTNAFYLSSQRNNQYGYATFYGNRFEGSSATMLDFVYDQSNAVPTLSSFFENYDVSGTSGSTVGWVNLSSLANVTNIVLTGWTPSFINGTYKLNSNASTFNGNMLAFMTWTNVLNTNNFITINDSATVGDLEIQDSTNYLANTPDFDAAVPAYPILNPFYVPTVAWNPFFGGTSGNFVWGTNQLRIVTASRLFVNLNSYEGGNYTESNGTFNVSGKFAGNGSALTNVTATSVGTTSNSVSAVTVGASAFLFTNKTPFNLRCLVNGGAATVSVGLNGTTIAGSLAGLDYPIVIAPTEYITLTYSVGTPALFTNRF